MGQYVITVSLYLVLYDTSAVVLMLHAPACKGSHHGEKKSEVEHLLARQCPVVFLCFWGGGQPLTELELLPFPFPRRPKAYP